MITTQYKTFIKLTDGTQQLITTLNDPGITPLGPRSSLITIKISEDEQVMVNQKYIISIRITKEEITNAPESSTD